MPLQDKRVGVRPKTDSQPRAYSLTGAARSDEGLWGSAERHRLLHAFRTGDPTLCRAVYGLEDAEPIPQVAEQPPQVMPLCAVLFMHIWFQRETMNTRCFAGAMSAWKRVRATASPRRTA